MPTKHALGFGNGRIMEYEDGTAAYIPTGSLTQAFRVQIADITGFSVTKGGKMLERTFNVLGNGTLLASVSVNHGTSEKIEQWFRSHPSFGQGQATDGTAGTSTADELKKLAELRDSGVLTEAEFSAAKQRLIGG